MNPVGLALALLGAYNLVVFGVYASDKIRAKQGWWRTSEKRLLWLAACGGGLGALLGIFGMRHKTTKPRFTWGVTAMTVVQVAAALWTLSAGRRLGWW